MLQPGTSALFLVVDKITADKATEALSKFGGRVLKTSLRRTPRSSCKRPFTAPITVGPNRWNQGRAPAGVSQPRVFVSTLGPSRSPNRAGLVLLGHQRAWTTRPTSAEAPQSSIRP